MAREYKNHLEYMQYEARMADEERKNRDFAEKLVLVIEIELIDLQLREQEILKEVAVKLSKDKKDIEEFVISCGSKGKLK